MDLFMNKNFIGFSFHLWSAQWLVAGGYVTGLFCVSTIVDSTLVAVIHNWSYTSKKNVSFPSRVTNPKVSLWCILKLNQTVFSSSLTNIAAFEFQRTNFLIKIVLLTDYSRPIHLDKEVRPMWLIGLEKKLSSYWFSTYRVAPV